MLLLWTSPNLQPGVSFFASSSVRVVLVPQVGKMNEMLLFFVAIVLH